MPVASYAEDHQLDIEWTGKQWNMIQRFKANHCKPDAKIPVGLKMSPLLKERAQAYAKAHDISFGGLIESMLKVIVDSADN